jgi:MFS family permease
MDKDKNTKNEFNFSFILRALKYRNYRLFFSGQLVSLIGTWMQQIALSWLVYRMTNSALMLGLVGFVGQIPTFLFSPFAGVLVDRFNKHKILIFTQTCAMMQAFIIVILISTGSINVFYILLLNAFLGIVNSFDAPTRQSFVVEMIENKEDLGNAIALNSMMFNSARLIGPSIAGLLIAAVGESMCFLINGISYIAVIIALLLMKINYKKAVHKQKQIVQELKEGWNYTRNFKPIKYLLLLLGLVSLMGTPYVVLMPVFARETLHGGPHTLGFLVGSIGVGAFFGGMLLASRKNVIGLGKIIMRAAFFFGVTLILFSFSKNIFLSMILLLIAGFAMMIQMASSNTIIQTIVEDSKRGRVMSFYTMSFMGTMPIGSLLAGFTASKIGATNTVIIGGICCIIGSLLFATRFQKFSKAVRPIYTKMGIIPEIAVGIESSSNLQVPPQD